MGKLIVTEFTSLDGVAQAPGQPEEDPEGGFEFGGWQAPLVEEATGAPLFEQAQSMDALLLGRKTYEIFAGYWPTAPEDMPYTGLLNRVPKHVATRSLSDPLEWAGSTTVQGDVVEGVAALKDRYDELHVIGSLDLVQTLLQARLVDQINLWVYPLVLGSGKRVFEPGTRPTALTLERSTTYPGGTVALVFRTDGTPAVGDMTQQ